MMEKRPKRKKDVQRVFGWYPDYDHHQSTQQGDTKQVLAHPLFGKISTIQTRDYVHLAAVSSRFVSR
jgi:hypothetical protein